MRIAEIITPDGQEFDLDGITNDIEGTQSHSEIIAIVEKHFPIAEVTVIRTPDLAEGELSISAHYEPDFDEEGDTAIFIKLLFSEEGPESFTWSVNSKKYFLNKLKDALKHEVLHMKQFRDRGFHPGSDGYEGTDSDEENAQEKEYMSRPDEIEAYAMNIGDEFIRKVGKDGAVDLLRMAKKTAQFKNKVGQFLSPDLLAYFALFNFDSDNPVIKRLLKKIYQHIQEQ
jgi:hypothetical protein